MKNQACESLCNKKSWELIQVYSYGESLFREQHVSSLTNNKPRRLVMLLYLVMLL